MRRRRSLELAAESAGGDLDITPLIDVVFILLIFLLVTTSFAKETGIEVHRPQALSATRKENGSLLIGVRADNTIWMEGREVDLRAIRPLIERLHVGSPQAGVVVVADREASAGVLVRVMDQARLAGIQEVSLAAEAESR
jgi:biopolymer transport protein ExbD